MKKPTKSSRKPRTNKPTGKIIGPPGWENAVVAIWARVLMEHVRKYGTDPAPDSLAAEPARAEQNRPAKARRIGKRRKSPHAS